MTAMAHQMAACFFASGEDCLRGLFFPIGLPLLRGLNRCSADCCQGFPVARTIAGVPAGRSAAVAGAAIVRIAAIVAAGHGRGAGAAGRTMILRRGRRCWGWYRRGLLRLLLLLLFFGLAFGFLVGLVFASNARARFSRALSSLAVMSVHVSMVVFLSSLRACAMSLSNVAFAVRVASSDGFASLELSTPCPMPYGICSSRPSTAFP